MISRSPVPNLGDYGVDHLAGTDCSFIVTIRFHVVGYALAFPYDARHSLFQDLGAPVFIQMAQHENG